MQPTYLILSVCYFETSELRKEKEKKKKHSIQKWNYLTKKKKKKISREVDD